MVEHQRLSRAEWTTAALRVMGERGVRGVAVEPLAKELGATKGSFYWHFRDREELITAALVRWEQEETDSVIALLRPLPDGRTRLAGLVEAIFITHGAGPDRSIALATDAGHPAVAAALARVTERRVAYVAEQLLALGIEAGEARHRALVAYTSYLGYSTLVRSAPGAMPHGAQARAYLTTLLALLTSPT